MISEENTYSGYISMVGRPNAGKSTIFNALLGEELSIVTPKPQTTWNRISGILTSDDTQIVFLDTPGIERKPDTFTKRLIETVKDCIHDSDLAILMVDLTKKDPFLDSKGLLELLIESKKEFLVVLNKMDDAGNLDKVHQTIIKFNALVPKERIFPVSALKGTGLKNLLEKVKSCMKPGPFYYPKENLSEKSMRFFVRELIRKQIFNLLKHEIPWSCAVLLNDYIEGDEITEISATIIVEREGQKGILIGKKAEMIREIGTLARMEIQKLVGTKVFLDLNVKVKKGWKTNSHYLKTLGIEETSNERV